MHRLVNKRSASLPDAFQIASAVSARLAGASRAILLPALHIPHRLWPVVVASSIFKHPLWCDRLVRALVCDVKYALIPYPVEAAT